MIRDRWERWLERSRLNPIGLLRMPWPQISPEEAQAFDDVLDSTASGGEIAYELPRPIGRNRSSPEAWTTGMIYVLPGETFSRTAESRELTSRVPVRPRARLAVTPEDFPFRQRTMEHRAGATPSSAVRRSALTRHRP